MGRFYSTQNHEGKFAFAVQPSQDPITVFCMEDITEEEDLGFDYFDCLLKKTPRNIQYLLAMINVLYDVLRVPQDKRQYEFEDEVDVFGQYHKYIYRKATKTDIKKYKNYIFYNSGDGEGSLIEICPHVSVLAASRLYLGLVIYNDLLKDGHCTMTAEL